MPLRAAIQDKLQATALRQFRLLSKGRGVVKADYYAATSGNVSVVQRNLYHDVIKDTGPGAILPIETLLYLELKPATKVVKQLGWWKEEDNLPILAYMPHTTFDAEIGAKLIIGTAEGYLSGTWNISKVSMIGQGFPIVWVCQVVPDRVSKIYKYLNT